VSDDLHRRALEYHREPSPGKIEVVPTKPLSNQRDLALAYSPGVAAACEAIVADPNEARGVTARGNLVAVITNGTAVLGLGSIGPLAAKPVMEGKGVLFKKFAGIDVFDIELDASEPDRFVDVVAALEPTFGAINLEDIKAPECFEIERRLRERLNIPVFHDDQHGTAIIVAAAALNALKIVGKRLEEVRLVASGAGAAAIACLDLLVDLGLPRDRILVCDRGGVLHTGREITEPNKARYARDTELRTLAEAIAGADVFLGLSSGGLLKPEMVASMAARPVVMALANPNPEILPDQVESVRDDAVVCTGRSDYPNQVNNVLCFPFIFRGALDVGATTINREMEIACVHAVAELARVEATDASRAYSGQELRFGPKYVIPQPFDPRLISAVAPAVARAAMESGVATRPIEDFDAYRRQLKTFVYKSGQVMRPLFEQAKAEPMRITYAEGEDERVLRATQEVVDEGLARPILVGRRGVIEMRLERLGLRIRPDHDFEIVDPQDDPRFRDYWQHYHQIMERRGVTPQIARVVVATRTTVIAALALMRDECDAMICGLTGRYPSHLRHIQEIVGLQACVRTPAAMTVLILNKGTLFQRRPRRRGPGADRHPGRARGAHLRHRTEGGAGLALQLRQLSRRRCRAHARRPGAHPQARARPAGRGRDACRRGTVGGDPPAHLPQLHVQGGGQPAGDAQPRHRQHLVQHAEDARWWRFGGADPARCQQARSRAHRLGDGAHHRQHDRAGRRRRAQGAFTPAVRQPLLIR
jgi:malate dehydrogenase (oxaloacetate-decarboxylating)(NADP+)